MIIFIFRVKGDANGQLRQSSWWDGFVQGQRDRIGNGGSQRSAAPVVWSALGRPLSFPSPSEGSGAPGGAFNKPHLAKARRIPCDRDARLSALHLRLSPSALAVAQLRAGFPSAGIGARLVQQAPCRAVLMPPDRGPGTARGRGYKPRPQAPHPAPPLACLRRRPSESRTRNLWQIPGILSRARAILAIMTAGAFIGGALFAFRDLLAFA